VQAWSGTVARHWGRGPAEADARSRCFRRRERCATIADLGGSGLAADVVVPAVPGAHRVGRPVEDLRGTRR